MTLYEIINFGIEESPQAATILNRRGEIYFGGSSEPLFSPRNTARPWVEARA